MSNLNIKESEVLLSIDGKVTETPTLVSKYCSTFVFRTKISVRRSSGVCDEFFLNYSSNLGVVLKEGQFIHIDGDIRTLNDRNTDFVIEGFIFAKKIEVLDSEPVSYKNDVIIRNAELHKFIEFRKSHDKSNKHVADYQIKITRKHGRYSYFKVTSWNANAVLIGTYSSTAKYLNLKCRLQSFISKKSGRLYLCLVTYDLELNNIESKKEDNHVTDSNKA